MKLASQRQRDMEVMGPCLKTNKVCNELQTYETVHGHAQADIQIYLKAHQADMSEIEIQRALEQEEQMSVEEEREITLANITRMQEISASHEAGYKKMLTKIRETDSDTAARVLAESAAAKKGDVPFPFEEVQLGGRGRSNPERLLNACTVANELVQRRSRQDRFQRRRRSCINEEVKKLDVLQRKHEEADKRAVSRQKELTEKQAEKTCAAQQRRGENQKLLKEIQKFQDHQFEKLQLKHHPEAVSTQKKGNHHQAVSSTSPPSLPSSSAPLDAEEDPQSPTEEPVHRRQVQSHKLYRKTLDKWNVYVSDNERRTEAFWLKMLDGQPREKRGPSRLTTAFRKTVQGLCTVHGFLTKTHGPSEDLEISSDLEDDGHLLMSPASLNSPSTAAPTTYEDRLERVRSYQADLQKEALEKRDRDTAALEHKQQKGKEEMRMKAERAKSHNSTWEKKSVLSSTKRETLAVRSDADFMAKLVRQKKEREEVLERKNEEMDALKSLKTTHSLNVKASGKMHHESMKDAFKEKQAAKHERLAGDLTLTIKAAEQSPKASDYNELAKGKVAIKSASEEAFSLSTAKSIEMKGQRAAKMKLQVLKPRTPMEALGRQRALHKEKGGHGARVPPPELTLTPGWYAEHEDLGLADMMTSFASCGSSMHHQESLSSNITVVTSLSSSGSSVTFNNKLPPPVNVGRLTLSSPGGDGSQCASGRSHRSSAHSSEEDDLEAAFLSELQHRSAKWLDVLRQKEEY